MSMMLDADLAFWRTQSPVSHPGASAHVVDALPADPDALTEITSQMVFHYRADGSWDANGIGIDRASEINLCYPADMFERLRSLEPALDAARSPAQRILGCCRDFSTLYVSILRHHQIPCRCRVGFAGYFEVDWWIDPAKVVVAPMLEVPETRGWPQLAHNLVHDLAALNGIELLLWQDWGASLVEDVTAAGVVEVLDEVATAAAEPDVPLEVIRQWSVHELLRVPTTVLQGDPVSLEVSQVDVSRAVATV